MSSLLGDMLARTLARKWRIESITRLELSRDLAEYLSGMVADLVVAERISGAPNAVTVDLLTLRPDISLLELSADGRMAWFYRSGSPMSVLVDFSAQELIDMLDAGGLVASRMEQQGQRGLVLRLNPTSTQWRIPRP